jgi:hypothetical protein
LKHVLDHHVRPIIGEFSLNPYCLGVESASIPCGGIEACWHRQDLFGPPNEPGLSLGRLGEVNDVDAVIAAVLSDDFRWVTGQHIEASGGARLSVAS